MDLTLDFDLRFCLSLCVPLSLSLKQICIALAVNLLCLDHSAGTNIRSSLEDYKVTRQAGLSQGSSPPGKLRYDGSLGDYEECPAFCADVMFLRWTCSAYVLHISTARIE